MNSDQKHSTDDDLGRTLRNLGSTDEPYLEEEGLLRAIQNSQELGRSSIDEAETTRDKELKNGDRLGDFVIEEKITQGGMGVIYSAIQNPLGRRIALKTVIPAKANAFMLGRFQRERKILGELHESNIVSVFAAGSESGIEYFAMPFINGMSLKRFVAADSSRPIGSHAQTVRIMIDLADGVSSVHQQGIIHRDITPNNVILDSDRRPWLIDFGIATKVSEDSKEVAETEIFQLSTDGRLGTPKYKAPELEKGIAGKQTDVFGLGVCFYCLLTQGDFEFEDFRQENSNSSLRLVPKPLAAICHKALAEDPADRYQTAEEFSEDLHRWTRNETVSCNTYPVHQRIGLWLKRNPIKSIATTAAFLILAAGSLAMISDINNRSKTREAELQSQLSGLESNLVSGKFDEAAQLISSNKNMLQISAEEDLDLFLKLIRVVLRSKGISAALDQISVARSRSEDERFLARLDLAEADVLYATDFEKSETLARKSLESNHLSEQEVAFARALLATNAIEEQKFLERVVEIDPFDLRAQQLLVMNRIFLGQESRAREQLAAARSLFPLDDSLKLANAIITRLFSRNAHQVLASDGKQFSDSDEIPNDIIAAFPRPQMLLAADNNDVVEEIDNFLIALHQLQGQMTNTGYVIFPPALYRALSRFEPVIIPNTHPQYWPNLEHELESLANANPDMLFLFSHARSLYSRPKANTDEWLAAEKLLEQALLADSVFPIRPVVIQQLAFVRMQIYYYLSGRSESAKEKMIETLTLLNKEGRMPRLDQHLFANIVEATFEARELDLAAELCSHWRREIELQNGTIDQEADALAYSAMVAIGREQYVDAFSWSSEAIRMAPKHHLGKALNKFRSQAANGLTELASEVSEFVVEPEQDK